MKLLSKPINFLKEVRGELNKVSWSSKEELLGATMVVIVITALMAIFIGIVDLLLSKILSTVFK
jgi:preprotein translocase subunit SecE